MTCLRRGRKYEIELFFEINFNKFKRKKVELNVKEVAAEAAILKTINRKQRIAKQKKHLDFRFRELARRSFENIDKLEKLKT